MGCGLGCGLGLWSVPCLSLWSGTRWVLSLAEDYPNSVIAVDECRKVVSIDKLGEFDYVYKVKKC